MAPPSQKTNPDITFLNKNWERQFLVGEFPCNQQLSPWNIILLQKLTFA